MPIKRYKAAKGRGDALFSQIIRSLGYCEAEGWAERPCSAQLQTAHIVTRKRSATRTDLRNAFCLCFAHHRYFTDYPREFSRFISDTWASDSYDVVYNSSITPTKVDWEQRVEFLEGIKGLLDSGELTREAARLEEAA